MFKRLLVAVIALVVLGGVGLAYTYYNFVSSKPAGATAMQIYEVAPGSSIRKVAAELEELNLIVDANHFWIYARLLGKADQIKVGEYALSGEMTPPDILAAITSGQSVNRTLTVSEGLNIFDIATLYEAQGFGKASDFLAVAKNPKMASELLGEPYESLEGYLFPETYGLTKFTTAEDLVRKMVLKFKEVYDEAIGQDQVGNMSRHQIVTLASIIEKETGAPHERPLISSVFHNRMKKNMRLQTDPTVLYGIWDATGDMRLNIKRKDLTTPTRYNTYTKRGLPHGPIANPGREALTAAVNPESSSYLYFVSRNDGTHVFSKTYEDHKKAVRNFQLNPKAREGKSWRDLNK